MNLAETTIVIIYSVWASLFLFLIVIRMNEVKIVKPVFSVYNLCVGMSRDEVNDKIYFFILPMIGFVVEYKYSEPIDRGLPVAKKETK